MEEKLDNTQDCIFPIRVSVKYHWGFFAAVHFYLKSLLKSLSIIFLQDIGTIIRSHALRLHWTMGNGTLHTVEEVMLNSHLIIDTLQTSKWKSTITSADCYFCNRTPHTMGSAVLFSFLCNKQYISLPFFCFLLLIALFSQIVHDYDSFKQLIRACILIAYKA